MASFDSDKYAARVSYMWRKLGGLYEKGAYALVERGLYETALNCARMADVCFWQATGEGEAIVLRDLRPTPGDQQ